MHILKIIHGYPPEYNAGSEVYSKLIVNQLSKTNKITVFTREENEYQADFNFRYDTFENINFVYVNMPRAKDGYNHQLLNQNFEHLLMQIKPDIAHIGHLNHLSTGIIDELNKAKIPIIFTLHDFWLMCPRGQFLQRNFDGQNIYQLCDFQEDSKCALNCYKMYFSDSEGQKYYTNWVKKRMQITKNIIDKVDLFIAPSKYLMKRFISDFKMPNHKI
ncbi:MAG: glycosyltransferase, partial [Bacteroidales bacterium]|nr:glycosyltransferase [Bacteroidales bacterium]